MNAVKILETAALLLALIVGVKLGQKIFDQM